MHFSLYAATRRRLKEVQAEAEVLHGVVNRQIELTTQLQVQLDEKEAQFKALLQEHLELLADMGDE